MRRLPKVLVLALSTIVAGCVTVPVEPPRPETSSEADRLRVRDQLERIGLVVIRDEDAWLPDEERRRVIPCLARATRFGEPPVPPHPAGYLIIGVEREVIPDRQALWTALSAWTVDQPLSVRFRRNPHRQIEETWWEVDVRLILPE